jgi:hypothetical protein
MSRGRRTGGIDMCPSDAVVASGGRCDIAFADAHFQKTKSPLVGGLSSNFANFKKSGAGEGIRTLDPDLGKVVLYH